MSWPRHDVIVTNSTTKVEKSGVSKDLLTYDDLLQIVELIKSAEAFSEFHLKIGEIELDLRKANAGSAAAGTSAAPLNTVQRQVRRSRLQARAARRRPALRALRSVHPRKSASERKSTFQLARR